MGEEAVVETLILDDKSPAKRATQRWGTEMEAKAGVGVWMWWRDGSCSDHSQVGAAAVWKHGNEWRTPRSYLCTRRMEVIDAELWANGLLLGETVKRRHRLQQHGVRSVAVCSDSQAAIRRVQHLEPVPGQLLGRWTNRKARNHLSLSIETEIHWVLGQSGIPWNAEVDRQPNVS